MNAWTASALAELTSAERQVADLLPIEADPAEARAVLDEVPYWFHTFALNRAEGIYAPGHARDHRYRVPAIPASFDGFSVLDIGSFDGFYAFLAEARGAERVVAVDNEQYVDWVTRPLGRRARGRRGLPRDPRAARLERRSTGSSTRSNSTVSTERFDFIFCCGILHRVETPGRLAASARPSASRRRQGPDRDARRP